MLSAQPREQVDNATNSPHLLNTPPRISSLETVTNQDISKEQQLQHQRQIYHQHQSHQNDNASSGTTFSKAIFRKQPWQKAKPQHSLGKKASNESLRSNVSTTSSIFSTASKISRLPNVVKASVKGLVAKSSSHRLTLMSHNQNSPSPSPSTSSSAYYQTSPPQPSFSFGYRLKKRSPSSLALSSMFSRRRASMDQSVGSPNGGDNIHPQESISYSVLKEESSSPSSLSAVAMQKAHSSNDIDDTPPTLHHRLSRLNLSPSPTTTTPTTTTITTASTVAASASASSASSALQTPIGIMDSTADTYPTSITTTTREEYLPPITSPVGKLLFGEKVDALFDSGSSSGLYDNNYFGTESGMEDNSPTQAEPILDVAQNLSDQQQPTEQLPFHMFLVTATLTTLRTKLLADCDRTLAASLQHPPPPFPTDDLKAITQDLRRMSDMMGNQKQPDDNLKILEARIISQAPVREITTLMKQAIHDNVCQYYKVHEKSMIIPCKGYNIEGINKFDTKLTPPKQPPPDDSLVSAAHMKRISESNSLVEHMDHQAHWFRTHFTAPHQCYSTFCGYDDEDEPILITTTYDSVLQIYRVITRMKQGPDRRDTIQDSFLLNAPVSSHHQQQRPLTPSENTSMQQHPLETTTTIDTGDDVILDTTWKAVIEASSAMSLNIPFTNLKKMSRDTMKSSGLEDDVLKLDESGIHTRYKFGILYVKEGQTKEEEWFTNEHDSARLDHFLNIIGQRIPLLGYTGWAAGLDTKSSDSGEFTYINTWQAHSIAYHVSTLIPSRQGDKQQIQRKRHIGNDIVCLVFVEGKQPFNPAAIKSQFLHVFIVVHKEEMEGLTAWRVAITAVESVPNFGPSLPDGGVFYDDSELQSFLLAKLINAEYAALKSPKFAQPLARAREGILTSIVERGYKLAQGPDVRSASSRHSKSPSTSSERSLKSAKTQQLQQQQQQLQQDILPTPSRSSMIKDLSEGIVGLGRRRSTQDSMENRQKAREARRKTKGISGTKQNQSAYEPSGQLETRQANLHTFKSNESLSHHSYHSHHSQQGSTRPTTKKEGLRQRAQTIFTSLANKRHQQQESANDAGPLRPDS